ncbi:hypothetical protein M434DRAFT_38707 [Hypoxylon sp. CO27-5]|nr:hypothetical protein M434DRAFT_38707 [Hypoxylon sp. CO27-5]
MDDLAVWLLRFTGSSLIGTDLMIAASSSPIRGGVRICSLRRLIAAKAVSPSLLRAPWDLPICQAPSPAREVSRNRVGKPTAEQHVATPRAYYFTSQQPHDVPAQCPDFPPVHHHASRTGLTASILSSGVIDFGWRKPEDCELWGLKIYPKTVDRSIIISFIGCHVSGVLISCSICNSNQLKKAPLASLSLALDHAQNWAVYLD